MKRDPLKHLERECQKVLAQLNRLRVMPLPAAAEYIGKSPQWIRQNMPVIKHNSRAYDVRLSDLEAYQQRRTIKP
jgi:hypothetical protein